MASFWLQSFGWRARSILFRSVLGIRLLQSGVENGAHRNSSRNKRYLVANNHTAFRNTISSRRKRRRMPLLYGKNNKRTIPSIQTTVLWAVQPHRMFQDLGIAISYKESTVRSAYTVEQYTHTITCASYVCKNTPKNSIVRCAVTQKFTQNAQQTSQLYSRC